ncbi:cell division protein ZapA [Palleniella muris]|uniref:Cell division protein ZapA n=2 Tax=Palleniella TaxID=2974369 RepID=A0AC61QQA1_9BACT|nr:cell division protein ZapA [Palleniella muris]TGX81873.1 cell division protein ZapA [Palleniella muris]
MVEENKLNIRLHIYDTDMAVKIDRQDEEMYRHLALLITEVVGNYTNYYKGLKSEKEILYMALVDIALRYEREAKRNDVTPFLETIKKLSVEINNALKEEQ